MDKQQLDNWANVYDQSDFENIAKSLPDDAKLGEVIRDHEKLWRKVIIDSGQPGARWAYWKYLEANKPLERFEVIVDKIFNGDAHHFAGMLPAPYAPIPGVRPLAWILCHPRIQPQIVYVWPEPVKERYERSKEEYDVMTGESREIKR